VFWPAFLMAAGLPLPKQIFAHGGCCSRTIRCRIARQHRALRPIQKVMGADALRYFLLREVVFGQDGSFSYDALIGRYNRISPTASESRQQDADDDSSVPKAWCSRADTGLSRKRPRMVAVQQTSTFEFSRV